MKKIFMILLILYSLTVYAQYSPGELPFTYINVATTPLSSALSMTSAAVISPHRDIFNPASTAFNTVNNDLYIAYTSHFAASHFGYIEYNIEKMRFGIKYFNSGTMEERDSLNNYIGDFSGNTILFNYSYGYSINNDFHLGVSALVGIENIIDYNQFAGALSAGIIYTGLNDFIQLGLYAGNVGSSYESSIKTILPARIIGGFALQNDELPVSIYIDGGKILDSDYFYSVGVELKVLKKEKNIIENDIADYNGDTNITETTTIFTEEKRVEEEITDTLNIERTEEKIEDISDPEVVIKEKLVIDSVIVEVSIADSLVIKEEIPDSLITELDIIDDSIKTEEGKEYLSYADYLEQMEEKADNGDESDDLESVDDQPKVEVKKQKATFINDIGFVLRGGVSSDKQMLRSGTSLDLVAGLSGGFGISYKNIEIDYAAKFWGELGIGHSIGIKLVF